MIGVNIQCGHCRHTADLDLFTTTPVNGALPKGTYQCPKCQHAWRLVPQGKGTRHPSGLYIPPDIKVEPIPSFL
jgi:hypothetical protein